MDLKASPVRLHTLEQLKEYWKLLTTNVDMWTDPLTIFFTHRVAAIVKKTIFDIIL